MKETNTPEQILKLIHAITTKNIGSLCYHNTYKYVDSIIIIVVITTIIITRPKPAYGRQGLAGVLLRASGAQLRSDEVIDKHTLYHNIYFIIRPQPA